MQRLWKQVTSLLDTDAGAVAMLVALAFGLFALGITALPLHAQTIAPSNDGAAFAVVSNQGQYQTDTWTWGGGIVKVVRTDRHDNESVADWNRRHKEAVMSALATFPPDHPQQNLLGSRWGLHPLGFTAWSWLPPFETEVLDHSITTQHHDGESLRDWLARHFDAVNQSAGDFPRV